MKRIGKPERATIALSAGLLTVALAAGGTTHALWNSHLSTPAGTLTNGNLQMGLAPDATFEVTPCTGDFSTPHDPDLFTLTPGDTAVWEQKFTAELEGNNAAAKLQMKWDSAPTLPEQWSGYYDVYDSDDQPVLSQIPLGEDAEVADVTPIDGVVTHTVVITVENSYGLSGGGDPFDPWGGWDPNDPNPTEPEELPNLNASAPQKVRVDGLHAYLVQVRQ